MPFLEGKIMEARIKLQEWMVVPAAASTVAIAGKADGKLVREFIHFARPGEVKTANARYELDPEQRMPGIWAKCLMSLRPKQAAQLKRLGLI